MHSVVDEEENIVDRRFHFGVSVTQRKELITPALHAYHHCHKKCNIVNLCRMTLARGEMEHGGETHNR